MAARELLKRTLWTSSSPLSFLRRSFSSKRVVDMADKDGELRVFVVAGEVSGDSISSRLMSSLKSLSPFPIRFSGVGGTLMHKEGLRSLFPMEDIAVMGIWELVPHLNKFRVKINENVEAAILFRPHVVVTVDSKGFSFRFLKKLRARSTELGTQCPVHVHYVAPSFWAWKGGERRLGGLSEFVDHLLCILPFEEEVCRSNGLAATFVGHPMVEDALSFNLGNTSSDRWKVEGNGKGFHDEHGLPSGAQVITLLPGSRLQEVTRMLPVFLNAVHLLKDSFPGLTAVIPVAPNHHVEKYIDTAIQTSPVSAILIAGTSINQKYDAFSASTAALCTSGTAVMELQLARLPCLVAYRAHFLTEWLIRYRTKLQYISLPNILMNSSVIPEALFHSCTPENLAVLARKLIMDADLRDLQIASAKKVFELLSPPQESSGIIYPPDLDSSTTKISPSTIAASTILYSVKHQ
ncbi:hypothetical protein QJS04_geneDACA005199 [Acorus gramineus]|uniref:lipid-A-disaccharide synthase n=1 Tax=Acorus gramineus TaxID=55184 RepID=A0AAV9AY06_ACOGR|nr:hypothetical protein QJS04_geneDACA005199 [Acorus gramineus]